ncbi:MAG: VOC family protein [Pseudomonadota bacterium]
MKTTDQFGPCSPFLIVSDIERSVRHYVAALGFECSFRGPGNEGFFAIVQRGSAQILLKHISREVEPTPNHKVHEWARWDAFVFVPDPDVLAKEFADRNVLFHRPLENTEDGLRGFEVTDPDDYVIFLGRPER